MRRYVWTLALVAMTPLIAIAVPPSASALTEPCGQAALTTNGNGIFTTLNDLAEMDPLQKHRSYRDGDEDYAKWLLDELKKNDGAVFVAVDGDKVVGHIAGCTKVQTSEDLVFFLPGRPAFIHDIYVLEEYRSKGVGARLLKHMEEYLKALGCDQVSLNAFTANTRSLAFYDREGYSRQTIVFRKLL